MSAWIADRDSTHNFTVAQRAQLSSMTWNTRTNQCIRWKWNRLKLSIGRHVEWIGS